MKEKYSLYEIIKPKLSAKDQRKVENLIKYHELVGRNRAHEEDEY